MSRRRQQSENALFIFCLLKNTIQPLGAKGFDLNQGAKLELLSYHFHRMLHHLGCHRMGRINPSPVEKIDAVIPLVITL